MEEPRPGDTIRLAHGTPGRDLYVVILVEEERAYCAPIHGDLRIWIPLSQVAEVRR
jgi:hypothetical protein